MRRAALRVLLAAAGLAAASGAKAQFVQLTRCQAAYPCNVPFGLQYKPEPLIAGQYGNVPSSAFSVRVNPVKPFSPPKVDLVTELDHQDWAREAARIFVLKNPRPKPTPPPEDAVSAQRGKN